MTVAEIFSKLSAHMLTGIMFHEDLANYYDFLGLAGYKRCHEYHSLAEYAEYRSVCRYYINHYNKLIEYSESTQKQVIPESWYSYSRQDVDMTTKKNSVRNGLSMWVDWERKTKTAYEEMYKEMLDIGEIAGACKIKCLIKDVDRELKHAERYLLNKIAVDYDMTYIIGEQDCLHDKYKKKTEGLGVKLC